MHLKWNCIALIYNNKTDSIQLIQTVYNHEDNIPIPSTAHKMTPIKQVQ